MAGRTPHPQRFIKPQQRHREAKGQTRGDPGGRAGSGSCSAPTPGACRTPRVSARTGSGGTPGTHPRAPPRGLSTPWARKEAGRPDGRLLEGASAPRMGFVEPLGCPTMLTGTEPMPAGDEGRAPGPADPHSRYFYPEPPPPPPQPGTQDDRRAGAGLGAPYAGGTLVPAPPGRFLGAYAYPPRPPAPGFPGTAEPPYPPTAGPEGYPPADAYAAPDPRAGFYPGPRDDYALPAGLEVSGKLRVALNNHLLWSKFNQHQTEMIITKQGR